MHRQASQGLLTYQFESLAVEGLVHAVFTRLGGVSQGPFATLNVGSNVGDAPAALAENHARIYAHLGVTADHVTTARQVHGNRVAVIAAEHAGHVFPATDGLVTAVRGIALMLRFADCQPILLYDARSGTLGLVHAGWRGIAQGIAYRAVAAMHETFGASPQDLLAGLGPAIGPCCYVVADNVASAMGYALPDWRSVMRRDERGWRLDLTAANAQQLAAAGVSRIERADICTSCRANEFFSHRAEHGRTGRFAVVAYMLPRGETMSPTEGMDRQVRRPRRAGDSAALGSLQPPGLPTFQESLESHLGRLTPSHDDTLPHPTEAESHR